MIYYICYNCTHCFFNSFLNLFIMKYEYKIYIVTWFCSLTIYLWKHPVSVQPTLLPFCWLLYNIPLHGCTTNQTQYWWIFSLFPTFAIVKAFPITFLLGKWLQVPLRYSTDTSWTPTLSNAQCLGLVINKETKAIPMHFPLYELFGSFYMCALWDLCCPSQVCN